ncbi:hypothetical protein FHW58_000982 [Duganella sp. 1224]|uniref:hypothetical protein n=1 Tax=Duganella sp. 1224 TaxID=2587052 RepID=UPI0015C956DD|nr:hypothetical protein [Duganella sp. 1224]NYE59830.1 hypothetical protein [Duganella sp. 1224]
MNAALRHSYGPLLAQLVQDKALYRQMIRTTVLFAVTQLVLFTSHAGLGSDMDKLLLMLMPWILLQMWAGAFMRNAIRQNRPEYACLVPNLRCRLLRLTAGLYLANTALFSVATGLVFGHPGYGLVLGGAMTVLMILMHRFRALSWGMVLAIPFGTKFLIEGAPSLLGAVSEVTLTLAVTPVAVLLGGWGLRQLLQQGGDRHWTWQASYSQRQDAWTGVHTPAAGAPVRSRLRKLFLFFYVAALRRDSRPGVAAGRAMTHVLGPGTHPATVIAYSLASTALALAAAWFNDSPPVVMITTTCLVQLGAVLVYAFSASDDVVLHGPEQQLYLLTPAAPAASAINRLLNAMLLRRALAVWLVSLACAVALDSTLAGRLTLRGLSFMLAMSMLWTVTPLLRNYAIAPARRLGMQWTAVIVIMVVACLTMLAMSRLVSHFAWYEVGSAIGFGALAYLALRWRTLMALPPVLPAGRLAR